MALADNHPLAMIPILAQATVDPPAGAFAGAEWLERMISGPLGTGLAVIAVAWFGLALLGGRLAVRRGGLLVMGCFILFSAPTIARSLLEFARQANGGREPLQAQEIAMPAPPDAPRPRASTDASPFDPYAGAAIRSNQSGVR